MARVRSWQLPLLLQPPMLNCFNLGGGSNVESCLFPLRQLPTWWQNISYTKAARVFNTLLSSISITLRAPGIGAAFLWLGNKQFFHCAFSFFIFLNRQYLLFWSASQNIWTNYFQEMGSFALTSLYWLFWINEAYSAILNLSGVCLSIPTNRYITTWRYWPKQSIFPRAPWVSCCFSLFPIHKTRICIFIIFGQQ